MNIKNLKHWPDIVDGHTIIEDGEQWIRVSRIEEYILPLIGSFNVSNNKLLELNLRRCYDLLCENNNYTNNTVQVISLMDDILTSLRQK